MNDSQAQFSANPDQAAFWEEAGPGWVSRQQAMDRQMTAMTGLLFERAAPAPGEHVIDIGCGAGQTARMHGEAVGADGRVLAVDISPALVDAARDYCRDLANVRIELGDAQVWPFESAGADLVTSRFGIMFFADPNAAFANVFRALKPGGRIAFVCWAPFPSNPWFNIPVGLANKYFGPLEKTPPRAPGPFAFAERDYVEELLSGAGFQNVRIDEIATESRHDGDAASQAEFFMGFGPLARVLRGMNPDAETLGKLQADLAEAFADYVRDGRCIVPMTLNFASATRP